MEHERRTMADDIRLWIKLGKPDLLDLLENNVPRELLDPKIRNLMDNYIQMFD